MSIECRLEGTNRNFCVCINGGDVVSMKFSYRELTFSHAFMVSFMRELISCNFDIIHSIIEIIKYVNKYSS